MQLYAPLAEAGSNSGRGRPVRVSTRLHRNAPYHRSIFVHSESRLDGPGLRCARSVFCAAAAHHYYKTTHSHAVRLTLVGYIP